MLVMGVAWGLYHQWWGQFPQGVEAERLPQGTWPWLLGCILLMPLNWLLETLKWREFTRSYSAMNFRASLRAVLAGVAASMLLPNRSGDYLGRLWLAPGPEQARSTIATLAGSYCQWVVLLGAGIPALLWYASRYAGWGFHQGGATLVLELVFLMLLVGVGATLPQWLQRHWGGPVEWPQWLAPLRVILDYHPPVLLRGLGWAALRYALYCLQYLAMLRFFGINLAIDAAFAGVGAIYLLQTSIPLPPVLGLLARGEMALLIWRPFGAVSWKVLAASYGLFTLNLGLPALVGLWFIIWHKKN